MELNTLPPYSFYPPLIHSSTLPPTHLPIHSSMHPSIQAASHPAIQSASQPSTYPITISIIFSSLSSFLPGPGQILKIQSSFPSMVYL